MTNEATEERRRMHLDNPVACITVHGHLGVGNLGDDAMLIAIMRAIRNAHPEATLIVVAGPSLDGTPYRELGDVQFRQRTFASLLGALWRSQVFVVAGGTHLHNDSGQVRHTVGLLRQLVVSIAARVFANRVFHIGVGVGPFSSGWQASLAKRILAFADAITVRDAASAKAVNGMNLRCVCMAERNDAALYLAPPPARRSGRRLGISVVPADNWRRPGYPSDRETVTAIRGAIGAWLGVYHDSRVTLIEFFDSQHECADSALVEEICSHFADDPRVDRFASRGDVAATLELFGSLTHVVSMRYHSAVFAFIAGVPQVNITYHGKNGAFMQSQQYRDCASLSLVEFGKGMLVERLLELGQNPEKFSSGNKYESGRPLDLLPFGFGQDRACRMLEVVMDARISGIVGRGVMTVDTLRDQGVETVFCFPAESGSAWRMAMERGCHAVGAKMVLPSSRSAVRNLRWLASFPFGVVDTLAIMRRLRIDVVHLNGVLSWQAAVAAAIAGKPVVVHLANTSVYPDWLVQAVRPFLRRCAQLIAISPKVRDHFLSREEQGRCRVIYEPIDLDSLRAARDREAVTIRRDDPALAGARHCLTSVGNITQAKGHLVLLGAVLRLLEQGYDVRCVIVGEVLASQQEYFQSLLSFVEQKGMKERVEFVGGQKNVARFLAQSDVFVQPSYHEGTPLAVLEAMAMQVPVVGTRVGGVPDIVEDGVSGLLVEPGDAAQLSTAIAKLLVDRDLAGRLARTAFSIVCARHSISAHASEFAGVIRAAAGAAKVASMRGLPLRRRRVVCFAYAEAGQHSGQREASVLIRQSLSGSDCRPMVVRLPGLDREQTGYRRWFPYAQGLVEAVQSLWSVRDTISVITHYNLGQTWTALIRDCLALSTFTGFPEDHRLVLSIHGSNMMNWTRWDLRAGMLRMLVGRADRLTVLGTAQVRKCALLGIPLAKLLIVNNTCATNGMSMDEIRAKHAHSNLVLHLSALIDTKGYPSFVQSLEILGSRNTKAFRAVLCGRLTQNAFSEIFGSVAEARTWLNSAIGRIQRHGLVSFEWRQGADGEEKWALYREAAIFVFPSRYRVEAQPIVLIEAMAHGCAIITSRVGEIPEMFAGHDAAEFLADTDEQDVAAAIESLQANPARRLELGLNARRLFEERFAASRYATTWKSLLLDTSGAGDDGSRPVV